MNSLPTLEDQDPSLNRVGIDLSSTDTIRLTSGRGVVLSAPNLSLGDSSNVELSSQDNLSLSSGDQVSVSTKQFKQVIAGKYEQVITGPTDFNMLSGASREVTVGTSPATGHLAGVADKYTLAFGDRLSVYPSVSNVTTQITTGSHNVSVSAGSINQVCGVNTINMSAAGVAVVAGAGSVSVATSAGVISLTSASTINLSAVKSVNITGASISLKTPSSVVGAIICAQDRDPTTGKTFLESGFILPPRGASISLL